MKNKILAIVLIIVVCFSIFTPMTVYAATTTTSASNINWTKTTINGNIYQMSYYHPIGLNKYYILQNNNSTKVIFYNDEVSTVNDDYRYGIGEFVIFCIGKGVGWPGRNFDAQLAICRDLLYNDESTWRASTSSSTESNIANSVVWHMTSEDGSKLALTQGAYEAQAYGEQHKDINVNSNFLSMEDSYAEWYYDAYGQFPPFCSTEDVDDIEFMNGKYYAIMQQPIKIIETSEQAGKTTGYVETVEDVTLESEDGTYVYVVISCTNEEGDIINSTITNWNVGGIFASLAIKLQEGRNGYDGDYKSGYIFWNKTEPIYRYYFKSKADAAKFVLYGTAGAEYQHKETGLTDFGYGYHDVCWNNYDLRFFGKNPIPQSQYPLERGRIILRWHDENVYEREYLMIDFNYFPLAVGLTNHNILLVGEELDPIYRRVFKIDEVNSDAFNPFDFSKYEETDAYSIKSMNSFYIYTDTLEEIYISNSWDVIYCTHSIYQMYKDEEGNITYGDIGEREPVFEAYENEDGHDVFINHATDELYAEGEENPYKYNEETGLWENENGDTINLNDYESGVKTWQESLIDYSANLEKITNVVNNFSEIIDYASGEIKPITSLLNAFFSAMPSIFKTIISFSIISVILARIIRRRGN